MIILFTYALMGMYLKCSNTQNGIRVFKYSPNIRIIEYLIEPSEDLYCKFPIISALVILSGIFHGKIFHLVMRGW